MLLTIVDLFILPTNFLYFWFVSAPRGLVSYFSSLNIAVYKFLSLGLLIRTFFKPWKNEYRQGLVGFSLAMGILIKSVVIIADLVILAGFVIGELAIIVIFLLWPAGTMLVLLR